MRRGGGDLEEKQPVKAKERVIVRGRSPQGQQI